MQECLKAEGRVVVISVVDYGVGNIGSVLNMLRRAGGLGEAVADPARIAVAEKIILPGVGSFDRAAGRLRDLAMVDALRSAVDRGTLLLGICLGMQLLSDGSEEGALPGLGLIPGRVRRFSFGDRRNYVLRVPHMGWNSAAPRTTHPLAQGLEHGARFYFVHSYYFDPADADDMMFHTTYGHEFASGVQRGNVMGVQFHPEKSHRFGMQLLKNFIEL